MIMIRKTKMPKVEKLTLIKISINMMNMTQKKTQIMHITSQKETIINKEMILKPFFLI